MKLRTDDPAIGLFYEATGGFVDRCLRQGLSLFLPDDDPDVGKVWTTSSTSELIEKFIERPDEGSRSFVEKLRDQLADVSRPAGQLLTELTWVHIVISRWHKPSTKRRIIAEVADVTGASGPNDIYNNALEGGIVSPGTSFNTRRPNQLWLLVRFADAWVNLSEENRQRCLADPWSFRDLVFSLEGIADQTQRHALLHLVHPDSFEDMVSQYHKADLVRELGLATEEGNVDQKILSIRHRLTPEFGDGFWFYQDDVRALWQKASDPTTEAATADTPSTDEIGDFDPNRQAWLIRGSGGERVPEWLERGICAVYFEDSFPFPIEVGATRDELRSKAEQAGVDTTAGGFNNELGQVWRFVNAVAIGDYVVTVNGQDVYLGIVNSAPHSTGERGRRETLRSVEWLNSDRPIKRSNVSPAVYSKLKTLLTLTNITSVIGRLEQWASGHPPSVETREEDAEITLRTAGTDLATALCIDRGWLNGLVDSLFDKKQIVLYGPPGTGKTYLAQELADYLAADGGTVELVQFHPSFAYEDFFEGYRPVPAPGGGVAFEIKPGPLKRLAAVAQSEPDNPHFLIIDEINRANLAKVFGELYFLLEYREKVITLQYSDEEFTLPENLFVIGTMNTADRSIALVDAAMRRRFYFVEMSPSREPVSRVLETWLGSNKMDSRPAKLLDELNRRIGDNDAAIGPSYFMHPAANDPEHLQRIWKYAIIPLLEERFYGTDRDIEKEFGFDAIAKAVAPPEQAEMQ